MLECMDTRVEKVEDYRALFLFSIRFRQQRRDDSNDGRLVGEATEAVEVD